jgi:hypothetical protein
MTTAPGIDMELGRAVYQWPGIDRPRDDPAPETLRHLDHLSCWGAAPPSGAFIVGHQQQGLARTEAGARHVEHLARRCDRPGARCNDGKANAGIRQCCRRWRIGPAAAAQALSNQPVSECQAAALCSGVNFR